MFKSSQRNRGKKGKRKKEKEIRRGQILKTRESGWAWERKLDTFLDTAAGF